MNTNKRIKNIKPLSNKKNKETANELLIKLSNCSQLIMNKYDWKVGTLCEMYPNNKYLLGLNINKGSIIKIRLRSHSNESDFIDFHSLMLTMLHELVHNRISNHDNEFYKLLGLLENDYYQQNNIGLQGIRLGGKELNSSEKIEKITKRARLALEPQRLGGIKSNKSKRELALRAAEQRILDSKTCKVEIIDLTTTPDGPIEVIIID